MLNGHDVANFVIQRLAAHHFGGLFTKRGDDLRSYEINFEGIKRSLIGEDLPPRAGLYLTPPPPHYEAYRLGYEIAPLVSTTGRRILGARVTFGPIGLMVLLDTPLGKVNGSVVAYRSAGIALRFPGGASENALVWEDGPASPWFDLKLTRAEPSP